MSVTIDDFAEEIISKNIDKDRALQHFQQLSEHEKDILISKLKYKFPDESPGNKPILKRDRLKALDQRDLNDKHRMYIEALADKYEKFVPNSKKNILEHQGYFVDQRRAFHLIKELKNLHFQITYNKAEGAYIYDIDGNKYIDISGDMGVNIFGHKPKFISDSIKQSLDQGIPLAGYSETIFKASKLFCDITGHERVLFTQSGTEAVMFAVRIARAATQRKKIVIFEGAYHGLSDAVVAMRDPEGKSVSVGIGMLQEFADQLIVLKYGEMSELDLIESQANSIAGVLVEPVQSRHPYKQPVEFLKELRKLTIEKGIALIFDEMITGFRVSSRGAQGVFNIKPDMATYGKIPGGGLPTGVIAGSAKYMDLIDGGSWQFGDSSMPSPRRTGMAGTHSQNPLKIAAVLATLSEIKDRCPDSNSCGSSTCFHSELNRKTKYLSQTLNSFLSEKNIPVIIDYFGSLFRFRFLDSYWGVTEALFFILLRMNGVETNIQGNCFITTAHTDDDIEKVIDSVKLSLQTLFDEGFFVETDETQDRNETEVLSFSQSTKVKSAALTGDRGTEKLKLLVEQDLRNFLGEF